MTVVRNLVVLLALASSLAIGCNACSKQSSTPETGGPGASSGAPAASTGSGGTPTTPPAADGIAYSGALPTATGFGRMRVANEDRRIYTYVPTPRPARPPLVVVFHGTGANESDEALEAAVAELEVREVASGAIIVAPASSADGGVNADHDSGGPGWRFDGDPGANPDLLLVRAIIEDAKKTLGADATHVYFVGYSNGAFFTYFAAMKLADRVAAFAENAGGLIPCGNRFDCPHTARGATSCADVLGPAPAQCKCAVSSKPFPTAKPSGRIPAGFLKHNADDGTVSPVYTCRLAEVLGARAQVSIDGTGDHGVTNGFMGKAWAFMSSRSLAD